MKNILVIYKEMSMASQKPFRIAEVFPSIDGGCRTRMTHKCFGTIEEAKQFVFDIQAQDKEGAE